MGITGSFETLGIACWWMGGFRPSTSGIPRSRRFACSRPFRFAKGARPPPSPLLKEGGFTGVTTGRRSRDSWGLPLDVHGHHYVGEAWVAGEAEDCWAGGGCY